MNSKRKMNHPDLSHITNPYNIKRTVSKERPGSVITKTLENRILIPIDTSKELDFYADFKYIGFIRFSLNHQKLRA